MTLTYNPPDGSYTSSIPPGTAALRTYLKERFGFTRTEVIRDKSRCNQHDSEHCSCRGIDAFTTQFSVGRPVFDWAVANADRFGLQSVIFQHRQWGFGNWTERHRAKADHMDHVHIGLNKWAAKNLTLAMLRGQEDPFMALTDAEQQELLDKARSNEARLEALEKVVGRLYGPNKTVTAALYEYRGEEYKEATDLIEAKVVAEVNKAKDEILAAIQAGA